MAGKFDPNATYVYRQNGLPVQATSVAELKRLFQKRVIIPESVYTAPAIGPIVSTTPEPEPVSKEVVVIVRDDDFYPVEVEYGTDLEQLASEHAGTLRIESTEGKILWATTDEIGLPTYVRVGGPPDDWGLYHVLDASSGEILKYVIEANSQSGEVLKYSENESADGLVVETVIMPIKIVLAETVESEDDKESSEESGSGQEQHSGNEAPESDESEASTTEGEGGEGAHDPFPVTLEEIPDDIGTMEWEELHTLALRMSPDAVLGNRNDAYAVIDAYVERVNASQ